MGRETYKLLTENGKLEIYLPTEPSKLHLDNECLILINFDVFQWLDNLIII